MSCCFHQECYGVKKIPEEDWYCDQCKFNCPKEQTCAICKQSGSGMKLTADGKQWAHLSCVFEIGEAYFKDLENCSEIAGVENVRKVRNTLKCFLCPQRPGAKIQCMAPHCTESFHPRCGLRIAGRTIDSDDPTIQLNQPIGKCVDTCKDEDGREITWWSWYCNKHLVLRHKGELKITEPKDFKGRRMKEKREAERNKKAIERAKREAEKAKIAKEKAKKRAEIAAKKRET